MKQGRTEDIKTNLIWQLIRKQIIKRTFVKREVGETPVIGMKQAGSGEGRGRRDA